MSTKEEYIARCVAHGHTVQDAENTWKVMESVERILDDRDVSSFMAPELVHPKKVRLTRLLVDMIYKAAQDSDKAMAAWLREEWSNEATAEDLAKAIENREHWKWAQKNTEKWDKPNE